MATGKELDELIQYHNKENQDDKVEKENCTTETESSMSQMPMMTEMTTLHRTSPLAWHCTSSTLTSTSTESAHHERAQSCSLCTFHHTHIWLKFEPCPHSTHGHHHGHPCGCCLFDLTSSFYFFAFLLSVFLFPFFHLSDEQQPELNKKIMESLCDSATNGCEGTYDVLYIPTGYEPNGHDFNELQNSSVPLSFKIPAADQDVDDLTLGKMLTEAYRGQVDYFVQEGVSVSQLSSSVRSDRSGQPDGDRSGQPDERESSKAHIWTLLEEQRQTILADCHARVSHHELQAAQAEEERRLPQGQLCQQKLEFGEAHQRSLTEMEELRKFQSSAFDTIARRKFIEDQNTILELSGKIQELQNEVNCMNDSKDFQDAESIRSGNSHVTSRPVSFPPHPIPEGMLRHSFITPSRREGPPSVWDTHGISGNVFLQIQMRHYQHLIHKNCINGIHRSKSRSIRPQ